MLRNYIRYIQHTLVREDALNNKKKALPQVRKADRSSDQSKWDMKSKLAVTTKTALGVDVLPRLSTAPRQREFSGEDNTVNLS
eukprot:16100934-Heterocapsa_arctica.AAC.1